LLRFGLDPLVARTAAFLFGDPPLVLKKLAGFSAIAKFFFWPYLGD
jgi:hypothetical protein